MEEKRRKTKEKRIPVTVLSGFLGAGKTTILNKLLSNIKGKKITVIVNDMSELNIDAKLIKRTEEKMIELSNGCICCTLREDLLQQLDEISQSKDSCDYLVIESTGIAEPLHIAETFAYAAGTRNGKASENSTSSANVTGSIDLDTMVTVVDSQTFFFHFDNKDKMYNSKSDTDVNSTELCPGTEERTLSHLLVDQLQFADVIVLNKCDLVSPEGLLNLRGVIADLNPFAKVLTSSYGSELSVSDILNTRRFSFSRAEQNAQWFCEEWADGALSPETEEYGISSRSLREMGRPFHPERLYRFYQNRTFGSPCRSSSENSRLLRSKGFVWLASRHDSFWLLHHTGGAVDFRRGGKWWAAIDPANWPPGDEFQSEVGCLISGPKAMPFGDRGHTLVLIGQHMADCDWDRCFSELRSCLLTDEEMAGGPEVWKVAFQDPFDSDSGEASENVVDASSATATSPEKAHLDDVEADCAQGQKGKRNLGDFCDGDNLDGSQRVTRSRKRN